MRLGYDLSIEQIQKLVMTPELIQAIQILQFNTQELENFIDEQLLTNPILDAASPNESEDEYGDKNYGEGETVEASQSESEKKKENSEEIDWSEYFKEYDDISYKQREFNHDDKELSFENFVSSDITLIEHLMFQLQFSEINAKQRKIGRYIIESLDSNGYITLTVEEIAEKFSTSTDEVEVVLNIIQTFEPLGVAARNLKECLMIQIKNTDYENEIIIKILENHLEDIAKNRLMNISKALNISVKEVQEQLDIIKRLEPKPGRQFSSYNDTKYIIPDVTVEMINGKYIVIVNDTTAPKLSVNSYYKRILMESDKESNLSKFLTGRLNSALWLIKSIEQRRQTIYNVVSAVVEYQNDFFRYGKKYLKPLTLKQVAEEVGIHESTVSRAINGKYMQCPRGIYEIKYFFTSGVSGNMGQGVASESVKSFICEIVENEDPKNPLSDQVIAQMLTKRGIDISRRTIAKYRDEMNLPSSSKRKRY